MHVGGGLDAHRTDGAGGNPYMHVGAGQWAARDAYMDGIHFVHRVSCRMCMHVHFPNPCVDQVRGKLAAKI